MWTGSRNAKGYGSLKALGEVLAHRVAWVVVHGPVPDGLLVCHRCDNPACILVDHLFIGTAKDNSSDMVAKGRSYRGFGEQSGMAKLTTAQVVAIRQRVASGETHQTVADAFGVHSAHVSRVVRGLRRAAG